MSTNKNCFKLYLILLFFVYSIRMSGTSVFSKGYDMEDVAKLLNNLDKRISSFEQPVWEVWKSDDRWSKCSEGPCRCSKETLTLACWRQGHKTIPRTQAVPHDIRLIDLSRNELHAMHKAIFKDLTSVNNLDISDNKLNYLPESLFVSLSSLRNLKLRNNRLEGLAGSLLKEQTELEILDVSFNKLRWFGEDLLRSCRRLRMINFESNELQELPPGLLTALELLEELNLSGNMLADLNSEAFSGLVSLTNLDLSKNNLTHLPKGLFRGTKGLEVLLARGNRLSFVEPDLFINLKKLSILDLTTNWISELSGIEFEDGLAEIHLGENRLIRPPRPARPLPSLRRLFLFSNLIKSLRKQDFKGYPDLRTLSLNHNLLGNVEEGVFAPLKELRHLQLNNNKLVHLPSDCFQENQKLTSVKLTKNPWHCDCAVWSLARWLKDNKDKVWGLEPTCLGPGEIGGRPIDEATYEQLCENVSYMDEEEAQMESAITPQRINVSQGFSG